MAAHFQQPTDRIVAGGVGKVAVPDELVVWPPGWIETTKYDPFLMGERAAREVIKSFSSLGVDLPIDYHHASIDPEQRQDGAAPAAGWITALRWDAGRGLIASVNWTERAAGYIAGYIANREFRYHSPVGIVRNSDKRFIELIHVSLTNEPATISAKAIAASRYTANGSCHIAGGSLRLGYFKKGKIMNPARQGEASVVERVGGAEVIEQFKKSLGAIAAVARKADLVELRELAQLFFPADLEALDLVLSKLDAMDRVTAVSDAPPDSPVDSFARPHAYELKIERMIAAGRASTKLHAIRIVRREIPRLFESYRMERLAGKKRTA